MGDKEREITILKNQIRTLRAFCLVGVIILCSAIINFQIQYSKVRAYYQSCADTNQQILRNMEELNPKIEKIFSNLR